MQINSSHTGAPVLSLKVEAKPFRSGGEPEVGFETLPGEVAFLSKDSQGQLKPYATLDDFKKAMKAADSGQDGVVKGEELKKADLTLQYGREGQYQVPLNQFLSHSYNSYEIDYRNSNLAVFDDPSAVPSPQEYLQNPDSATPGPWPLPPAAAAPRGN